MKLKTFIAIYDKLNRDIFANVLIRPMFRFTRSDSCHMQYVDYNNCSRTAIEINPIDICNPEHARAIMYHEMIHQYVHEHLHMVENNDHGPIFWRNYRMFAPKGIELGESL